VILAVFGSAWGDSILTDAAFAGLVGSGAGEEQPVIKNNALIEIMKITGRLLIAFISQKPLVFIL